MAEAARISAPSARPAVPPARPVPTAAPRAREPSPGTRPAVVGPPPVRFRPTTGAPPTAGLPDPVKEVLRAPGPGEPLPSDIQTALENRLAVSLQTVRVHTDPQANAAVSSLGARAFTSGSNIFLGPRERPTDLTLIAHEVAHVIQQQGAPAVQMLNGHVSGDRFETEAAQTAAAVQQGERVTVQGRTGGPRLQGFLGIDIPNPLDWLADKANIIPGFRMFTIILGVNPINMSPVARSAANILRALIEFLPGGGLITQALDNSGVFEKAGAFVEKQIATLGMTGSAIKAAVTAFIDGLSLPGDLLHPGATWERAKSIFTDPIERIKSFGIGLVTGIIEIIKDAILKPIAKLAEGTEGYNLLKGVLGKDPITGEAVPRSAETLLGPIMKMIGQGETWDRMRQTGAIGKCWAWFLGVIGQLMAFVSEIPSLFISAFKSLTIEDIILVPKAFVKLGKVFLGFLGRFISWGADAVWKLLEIIFDVVSPGAFGYIKKTGAALKSILKNPLPFVGNLVKAAKAGFMNFGANFLTHLKAGLLDWLVGSLPGVYIPKALSLVEFGKLALSVFGITWAQIRGKIVKVLGPTGETIMQGLEAAFDVVKALVTGGPAAAWEVIKEKLTNLKDMIVDGIIGFIKDTVVQKAIPKLIAMFIPGAGFISAIISIYDTVMVFVQKISKIIQVVTAFINSIVAIAAGNIGAAAAKVESILAGLLALAINFLAGFVGLGKAADKIREVINKVRDKVDKAIDTAIAWIMGKAKALFAKLFGKKDKGDERTDQQKKQDLDKGIAEAQSLLQSERKDRKKIESNLKGIKAKYKMTELTLVSDSKTQTKEVVHVHGVINPERDTSKADLEAGAERPQVTVPFALASAGHELTFEPQGDGVEVEMASGNKLPLTQKFHDAHVAIDQFKHYMTTITEAQIRREFDTKLLPQINALQAPQIAEFNRIYNELFPKPSAGGATISETEAKSRVQVLVTKANSLLSALKAWGATSGIPDLSKDEIDTTLRTKGDEIWRKGWEQTKQGIIDTIKTFSYKGAPVQFTGSSFTGWRGPHKGMTHFDARDFDVDLYVVHAADYTAAERGGAPVVNGKIFPSAAHTPQLLTLSRQVAAALAGRFPTVPRVGTSSIVLRKS